MNSKNPVVYVVQEALKKNRDGTVVPRVDLTPAESYGEIQYLLAWSDTKKLPIDQIIWKLRRALANFTSNDYILMIGSPTAMWLSGAIAAENNEGYVKTLEWDNNNNCYNVIVSNLNCQPL